MIKKLRTKFIIMSTVSLLVLLVIIVLSSNLLAYREMVKDADNILSMISDRGGRRDNMSPPEKIKKDFPKIQSPEVMYEARFFVANVRINEQEKSVNTENIIMVDDELAMDYTNVVLEKSSKCGFIGDFRFKKVDKGDEMLIFFLDCGRKLHTFKNTLIINCLISFAGFIIISIIIVFYSKKIVGPVSESYEKQKQFISIAGHEIKTPLTIIDADSEVLRMDIGEDNEWLEDICKQTSRLAQLTNDMLSLSRMDAGKTQSSMIKFPISDVIYETVQSFQTLARSNGHEIESDILSDISYLGDERGIRQLVGILLDNAIKYSIDDTPVKLCFERKGHSLILSVQNKSEHYEPEQIDKFFDRFYRTEKSRASEKGGYGLGLSIAKAIVELHKGKITATIKDTDIIRIKVVLQDR